MCDTDDSPPELISPFLTPVPIPSPTTTQSSQRSSAKKRKLDKCQDLMGLISKRYSQLPATTSRDKYDDIGKAWGSKLRDLPPQQAIFVQKLINDAFFEAEMGNLTPASSIQVPQIPQPHCNNINPQVSQSQGYSYNFPPPINPSSIYPPLCTIIPTRFIQHPFTKFPVPISLNLNHCL